jgi:hypothetical protein
LYYWKFTIFQPTFMQKSTKYFLKIFLPLIAAYHIIVTILWYGIIWWNSQTIISIVRDFLWLAFIWIFVIWNNKSIKDYLKKWKNARLRFAILIIFSLWISFLHWTSLSNMAIWIKYWFFYLLIFLSASFVWFAWIKKINMKQMSRIQYLIMWILIFGFLWQILKIVKPEIFMALWYGKLNDFYYWDNPPIYYLTWYEGTMRWQWIFSWPNNYWYFLVAFLPLILLWWWWTWEELKDFLKSPRKNLNFLLTILRIVAIILTLSRSALLWMVLVFALLGKNWIKNHKKASIWILLVAIAWIVWLSFLKPESTLWHLNAKFSYVWEIIDNPLWHWLGSSGPAVHHEWTMLPENYFMQIMLDIWTVWFILWAITILAILIIFKNIENYVKSNKLDPEDSAIYLQWKRLYIWWITLFLMWLFLHVFEDSMVNYIFFVMFGLLSGYLSKIYDANTKASMKNLLKK